MTFKIRLKNAEADVLLDPVAFEWLSSDPFYVNIKFLSNLRRHSSGCAFFQKSWKKAGGGSKIQTIYLHKLIAENFLADQKKTSKPFVGAINGNKLDCRIENLIFRDRADAGRERESRGQTGLRGVYVEHGRFRASIKIDGKAKYLGYFETPEEAAQAYDRAAREAFGDDAKLNRAVPKPKI